MNFVTYLVSFYCSLLGVVPNGVIGFFHYTKETWNAVTGNEYCGTNHWTEFKFEDFQQDLRNNVFGQPLVLQSVGFALKAHQDKGEFNSKPLVLSFHGWQGSGKNFVAEFIAKHYFKKGMASKYVHFLNGRDHFPLERHVPTYQYELRKRVGDALWDCPRSMFIFDEVDKIPRGVLDALKPFLDYHHEVTAYSGIRVNARQAIFIFLSNTGKTPILDLFIEYWKNGKKREDLSLNDFDTVIQAGAFNEKGGLQYSESIESSLIDHYVPFLPLEKTHVIACIDREIPAFFKSHRDDIVQQVMKTITWGPEPEKIFSKTGCKRVTNQVQALVERFRYFNDEL